MSIGIAASPASTHKLSPRERALIAKRATNATSLASAGAFRVDVLEMALYFVALMVGAYALLVDRDALLSVNTIVPALLIAALGWGSLRLAIEQVETILTPMFVMRIAILFYGGIGSLIPLYTNDETREFIEAFFRFSDEELLKYNIVLVCFSISFTLSPAIFRLIFSGILERFNIRSVRFTIDKSNLPLSVVSFAFLGAGAVAKYFVILPFQFGLLQGTFPLFIAQIAFLEMIGLFLALVWSQQSKPFFTPFLIGYGVFVSLVGVLTFSKSDVIFPIIMIAAALVYIKPNLFRIGASLALILIAFNFVQPVASHGRAWMSRCCASIDAPADFSERIDIIGQYFNGNALTRDDGINYALVRFSYANIGTYVVSARDGGWEGDSLKYMFVVFIPRVIWPEKPSLTDIAVDLNVAITGNPNSAVAPGFAAEGYWDGGWLGVVLMGFGTGLVCYLWSLYALEVQRVGAWHLFVIVLLGIRVGSRVDGFVVTDLIGPTAYAMVGHVVIMLLNRTLAPRN